MFGMQRMMTLKKKGLLTMKTDLLQINFLLLAPRWWGLFIDEEITLESKKVFIHPL